jgi:hypothetical protein
MSQLQVTGEAKIRDIQGPVVANSGVITALDGAASQYVRGDGTLADFPTSTGGGSSVSYYLNSSVSQGTIGGVAYRQLGKTPIIGAGTDITISANGYVASYITDANDPALLEVPAGNFNCEFYFSVNSNNHNPFIYAEVYKYDGTTFSLIGTSVGVPEYLSNGTTLSPYYFAIPVSQTVLTITDRIAIRIYVNVDGRVVTLHTENGHLCQVVTTFSKGLTSLNNLTRQVQFLATGTSGTDFGISSSVATHTFNLPVASATNTGKLSSTDWSTFNNKQNTITDPITGTGNSTQIAYFNSPTSITSEAAFNYDASLNRLGVNTSVPNATIGANAALDSGYSLLLKNDNTNYNGIGFGTDSTYGNLLATEKLGTAPARNLTLLNQSGYISITEVGNLGVNILNPNTGLDIYNGTSAFLWLHTANSGITGTDGVRLALFSTNAANLRNYEGAFSITAEGDFSIITIGAENFRVNSADGSIYQSKVANAMLKSVSGVITAAVANTDYQSPISLTTSGSSGAATFSSNILNVPNYTLSGLGGVPSTRTITINGTSQDLSADRTYNVGTITGSGGATEIPYFSTSTALTSEAAFNYDASLNRLGVNTSVPNATIGADAALDSGYGLLIKTGASNYNGIGIAIDSTYGNLISTEKLGSAVARNLTLLNQSGFVSLKENGNFGVNTLNPSVSGTGIDVYSSTSTGIRFHTATSGLTVNDGAGINFSAANNLGITNYENGTIDIVTNSNSGVFVAANGFVGINGATPSVPLTVNGAGLMSGSLTIQKVSGISTITFPAGTNDPAFIQHIESTPNVGIMRFSVGDDNDTNDYFAFGNANVIDAFRINANGTVQTGIWQATAIADAYIASASTWNAKQSQLNGTGFVKASGTTISYDNSTYLTTSAASSTYLALTGGTLTGALNGTSASFSSTLTAGDTTIINVAPILAIQSNTTGNIFLRFRQSADTMASLFYTNATASFTMSNNMGGLRFNTSGVSDAMNILSNGNVGIGTSSPTQGKLQVENSGGDTLVNINNTTTNGSGLYMTVYTSGSLVSSGRILQDNSGGMRFYTGTSSDTERMRITSDRKVLFGTTTYAGVGVSIDLDANIIIKYSGTASQVMTEFKNNNGSIGSIVGSGSVTTYNVTSDYRLKQDFKDFNALELVSNIKTYDYEWKSDKRRMYGVIAHELQEVLPYAVQGKKDELESDGNIKAQSVDYSKIVPILVKAIQELKAEIEELSNKIVALESK